ncbi:MAG: type I CRISPR-associated protein Cas7, partial [SAR324 cluster bacterium]|nr:type I CRISPR-associated protein Cas7 [SAR324 cluster bacterium]
LKLLWEALNNMFEHDRSAARGEMGTVALIVFRHESKLGNVPARSLFNRVKVQARNPETPPRDFSDYEVAVDESDWPGGVDLIRP